MTSKRRIAEGCSRVELWPDQMHRLRRLLVVFGAVGLTGCDSVTDPASEVNTISLSVASVTLQPGTSQQVVVTVVPQARGVRLAVKRLPPGLGATLSPDSLAPGETHSTLTVAADATATSGEATLTVGAAGGGAGNLGLVIPATLKLYVVVAACPGYADPSHCPPFPTGGSGVISGVLRERSATGSLPRGGASVWAWVQFPDHGYSAGRVQTNANGEYRFPNLPGALIILQAGGGGYDQPCASAVAFSGSSETADLEVVSDAAPIFDPDPPPPALIGVVYENTASGRQPVPGARVFFETLFEIVAATTTTDELGRYSLCRLPPFTPFVTPVKEGYVTTGRSVSVSGVTEMDLEMKRQ